MEAKDALQIIATVLTSEGNQSYNFTATVPTQMRIQKCLELLHKKVNEPAEETETKKEGD